jgi:hypothetical protein
LKVSLAFDFPVGIESTTNFFSFPAKAHKYEENSLLSNDELRGQPVIAPIGTSQYRDLSAPVIAGPATENIAPHSSLKIAYREVDSGNCAKFIHGVSSPTEATTNELYDAVGAPRADVRVLQLNSDEPLDSLDRLESELYVALQALSEMEDAYALEYGASELHNISGLVQGASH